MTEIYVTNISAWMCEKQLRCYTYKILNLLQICSSSVFTISKHVITINSITLAKNLGIATNLGSPGPLLWGTLSPVRTLCPSKDAFSIQCCWARRNRAEDECSAAAVLIQWPENGEAGVKFTGQLLILEKSGGDNEEEVYVLVFGEEDRLFLELGHHPSLPWVRSVMVPVSMLMYYNQGIMRFRVP